jgi:CDP-diacylglycerol pyrophosphatase
LPARAEETYLAWGSPAYSSAVSVTADVDPGHTPGSYADNGHVVLKAPKFPHEYLLLPTAPITGVEDHHLLDDNRPNYFAAAIQDAGEFTMKSFKPGELPPDAIDPNTGKVRRDFLAFAANSMDWRSQDRLHIHSDILDPVLRDKLRNQVDINPASKYGIADDKWTDLKFDVNGHNYSATWTTDNGPNQDQLSKDPVKLLHDKLAAENGGIGTQAGEDYATAHMGEHSIVVVPETRTNPDGTVTNGHVVIIGQVDQNHKHATKEDFKNDTETYDGGFAEEWLFGHKEGDK